MREYGIAAQLMYNCQDCIAKTGMLTHIVDVGLDGEVEHVAAGCVDAVAKNVLDLGTQWKQGGVEVAGNSASSS
jgi:hypothetical protein